MLSIIEESVTDERYISFSPLMPHTQKHSVMNRWFDKMEDGPTLFVFVWQRDNCLDTVRQSSVCALLLLGRNMYPKSILFEEKSSPVSHFTLAPGLGSSPWCCTRSLLWPSSWCSFRQSRKLKSNRCGVVWIRVSLVSKSCFWMTFICFCRWTLCSLPVVIGCYFWAV